MSGLDFSSINSIRAAGFEGFCVIQDLQAGNCAEVPKSPGVYMVVREDPTIPAFTAASSGGHFKGKNPTVDVERLTTLWRAGAIVIYIGRAGGGTSTATLKKRLGQFMKFGQGTPIGHWGGRCIWQIPDIQNSLICWRATTDAIAQEARLIARFVSQCGGRPFANLRD
jgi:hypothetical protein